MRIDVIINKVMRIVGGLYRHRIIEWPDDAKHIRPTKDRVREAIFSAIGDISNKTVLDLYAGSGAMGIEAISRGASSCYFVDINNIAISTVKKNLASLNIKEDIAKVIKDNDTNALKSFINNNIKFDVVILDPPYALGEYQKIIDILVNDNLLNDHAIIINESNYHLDLNIDNIKSKEYNYGETKVLIIWR